MSVITNEIIAVIVIVAVIGIVLWDTYKDKG
jgi:hypothetical protein